MSLFLDVSPKIFELQRRTVPHFKAKVIIYNSFLRGQSVTAWAEFLHPHSLKR